MKPFAFLALFACLAAACTGDGDAEYAELAIGTADPMLDMECVPLPLTPGAEVVEDLGLAPGISAHVVALPESIDITLGGTTTFEHRRLTHDQVYDGFAERIVVQGTYDGTSHTVVLVSPCDTSF